MIRLYNIKEETHNGINVIPIYRGKSILGNPYTHITEKKTKAKYVVATREEAIEKYSDYFDLMYGGNKEFKALVDYIYDLYKKGEDVYLGCYCYPKPCHGEVIINKLKQRLLKEKIKEIKRNK